MPYVGLLALQKTIKGIKVLFINEQPLNISRPTTIQNL
jgi:hypothetical protein